jgi:hypothetical protein
MTAPTIAPLMICPNEAPPRDAAPRNLESNTVRRELLI